MAEEISLPSSSRGELEKIIKGYGHVGKEVDLETLSKLTAIGRTTISANNPFLSQVGIITGGKKKQITESGKKLARAFDHNIQEQISHLGERSLEVMSFYRMLFRPFALKVA